MENIIKEIYNGFFQCDNKMPERRIICNESASYHGMANVSPRVKPILNDRGLVIRYEVSEIYLKKSVFSSNSYYDALATYLHEMCHAFGGNSSNAFSQSLTFAMEILLINSKIIEDYRQQWIRNFKDASEPC